MTKRDRSEREVEADSQRDERSREEPADAPSEAKPASEATNGPERSERSIRRFAFGRKVEPERSGRSIRRFAFGRNRSAAVIGVLTLLLGFAIVTQVRANSGEDSLSGLREDDLISILDNQNDRATRLRQQLADLQDTLRRLRDSGDRSAAARDQARQQADALGVLLGTLPASGPGVRVRITDPDRKLTGEDLLDVVQELRGAGAEAIQFGSVRVSTDTSFEGDGGSVTVDGTKLTPPYRVLAIGGPKTLDTALNIPGGIAATVRTANGDLSVAERGTVRITVTRSLPSIEHAKPR